MVRYGLVWSCMSMIVYGHTKSYEACGEYRETRLKSKVFSLERLWTLKILVPSPSQIGLSVVFNVGRKGVLIHSLMISKLIKA